LAELEDSVEPLRLELCLVFLNGFKSLAQPVYFGYQLLVVLTDALNLVKTPFLVLCRLHEALQDKYRIIYIYPQTKSDLRH
jgi:hypothetical protein